MTRSTSVRRAAVLAALLAASCADAPRGLLTGAPNPPPEVQQACSLATTKCSRCHAIDRVVVARGIGVGRWQMYIEQMRLKPSSGISVKDADVIFQCMRFVEDSCTDCRQGRS
ncbi:MAG TPA: hypothetical protein VHW23_27335 [Kofleriaceae bacterium]|jgi:hypothetical protein|nr:hypothetical protein [Kofleriaceae bacterium]